MRRQKHVASAETFATITDERLAEMIQTTDKAARQNQAALHALRMEQRRRRRGAKGKAGK